MPIRSTTKGYNFQALATPQTQWLFLLKCDQRHRVCSVSQSNRQEVTSAKSFNFNIYCNSVCFKGRASQSVSNKKAADSLAKRKVSIVCTTVVFKMGTECVLMCFSLQ